MADFDFAPNGKDQNGEAGAYINGTYYSNSQLIKALGKALIQKGTLTKADIVAQL